ncbi:hypothetical protein KQI82_03830 [Oscillibacter sp. MSJ-2]|uniref:Uncharacterized protein n=1 Tax=Dysosmobacter acutus TaxID=2841504 RepID=A0ABS6F8V8_9FIRM|nr:hypothetical protein [Dysosmobacter acutus]MBU5626066.1 hypothetical protein [Dysosmobacter acutus]
MIYTRAEENSAHLSDRLMEAETRALRRISAGFERVKRAFGPREAEVVEVAKQREQAGNPGNGPGAPSVKRKARKVDLWPPL